VSSENWQRELHLQERLPGIIERNAAAYHAVRTAMARRDQVAIHMLGARLGPPTTPRGSPNS